MIGIYDSNERYLDELEERVEQMEKMKCSNCAHWRKMTSHDFEIGRCEKAKLFDNMTQWNEKSELEEVDPTNLMYVQDGSSYYACLYSKPEFFCAHFEEMTGSEP